MLGLAKGLAIKMFEYHPKGFSEKMRIHLQDQVEEWLEKNPKLEIIDIKFVPETSERREVWVFYKDPYDR